ncbi:poly-gamma-glutamate synthesis protein (capsule biosynthesis protein) [Pseudarthrobacter oxydans]|uniref:Poly-gamma-glutamate synthesis protein (Capsule biosynthesis protein) n=1 Tax=Pseudarthrobacter oxydans TaxID=1671 RepID=A0AAW8N7C6_PSEOX|nr:CapA family protein [Pseudarthrobacter oxydans]MDR6790981.1 poly-gamma-glutamate synthesis protein (capsule biosynthesis protein) [Pseudarthrobacter oxydans]MDR7162590.1 poly-gamma-glutamate synthesis protein (capsule biosynthesis protein) [Pseudarthrobacter oxydans]
MPKLVAAAIAAALLGAAVPLSTQLAGLFPGAAPRHVDAEGLVTDETGRPLAGAEVASTAGQPVHTGEDGTFPVDRTAVYTARKEGHLTRAAAGTAGAPLRLVLRAEEGAVSLRFGGDAMLGRRFYEAPPGQDPHLPPGASVDDHARLLAGVAPLLNDSDVAVVNLESPLVQNPYFGDAERPAGFHPTKDIAFASALESAEALKRSGVDVVTLGNNHAADALGPGITSTMQALDKAGVLHTGAGLTEDEAWKPAVTTVRGRSLAFISCTTVDGKPGQIPYVAGPDTPGAAECSTKRLQAAVRDAKTSADVVTVMMHGDVEYQRAQSPVIRKLTEAAQDAGARVVVNGHPHVVGGLASTQNGLAAESMGNLLFDQTLWSTLLGYLLRVEITPDGTPVASTDALSLQDFVPLPAVGGLADASARIAAGTVQGSALLGQQGATVRPGTPEPGKASTHPVPDGVHRIAPGWWVSGPGEQVRVGQDLLWGTGSFADQDGHMVAQPSALWTLGQFAEVSSAGACGEGLGLQMLRSPVSQEDVYVSTRHRQQITPGSSLSLIAEVRGASKGGSIELSWYSGNKGPSSGGVQVPIPESSADSACEVVRIDAVAPPGITAAQPYLRLAPPNSETLSSSLYVDNVRLVEWAATGAAGRLYDSVEGGPDVSAEFTLDPAAGPDAPGPLPAIR